MVADTILIIDDSPLDLDILTGALEDSYRIKSVKSAHEALQVFEQVNPSLVLTDVVMDGFDGYECCAQIKAKRPDIPVIFVSSNSDTDEVIKGLDAGGFDYLFKPIDVGILYKKVALAIDHQKRLWAIQEQQKLASEVAYTAMNNASDLGAIIEFLRKLAKAQTLESLADSLVAIFNAYSLHTSFLIYRESEPIVGANSEHAPPLDIEILKRAKEINQRIFERGARLIVTYENVSFLVKNLPSDNEKRIGELRDCLAILAESTHEVYRRITALELVETQRENILNMLAILTHQQQVYKESSVKVLDDIATEVEMIFSTTGLTDQQEQDILNVIRGGIEKGLNQMEQGLEVDEKVKNLTASLRTLTSDSQRLAH